MGVEVGYPPIDDVEAVKTVVGIRERLEKGELRYFLQLEASEIERVERYVAKLLAAVLSEHLSGAGWVRKIDVEYVSITPSSVSAGVEVYTTEASGCAPGDFGCVEERVRAICHSEGHEKKLVIKYVGKRLTAKKYIVYHGSGISYYVDAAVDAEGIGLEAATEPGIPAGLLARVVLKVLGV